MELERLRQLIAVIALFLCLPGCGGGASGSTTPSPPGAQPPAVTEPPAIPTPPAVPAGSISRSVIAAYHGTPIAGATVAVDGVAPAITDGSGYYTLSLPSAETRRVVIAADGYQYRETSIRGGETRNVTFDFIPGNGSFPLTHFRQMARGTWDAPGAPFPLKRWTVNPDIHIENVWRDTGAPIPNDKIEYFVGEIRRAIPLLTDGKLSAGRFVIDGEFWQQVPGFISVHFDHSSTWSLLGEMPGIIQFGLDDFCTSSMIVHEFGHAMGYYHTSARGTVMSGGIPASCAPQGLSSDELQVVRVLYNRPVGNVEPDRDPQGTQVYSTPTPAVVKCDHLFAH
jgi:hypothetical protein